jgi:hypothetical protein
VSVGALCQLFSPFIGVFPLVVGPVGLEPTTYGRREYIVHRALCELPSVNCQDQSGRLAASWEGSVTASWRPERRIYE